jgi:3-oxoacyl-[acyl-carrier protein] reductase
MDLGIGGRTAFVSGGSKGLGRACALALASEGVNVTILARDAGRLEKAAAELSAATGVEVTAVAGDISTEKGRADALAACPDPDILVNNAGDAPPRGDCLQWGMEDWQAALNDHMLTSLMMIRATVPGMVERGFGRVVNITSGIVKMPIANMALATAPRLGLTGFAAGLARQVVRNNVTINNLLPGAMDTERFKVHREELAKHEDKPDGAKESAQLAGGPAGRWGDPAEFGAACAFLSSAQAGYITGQSLSVDGGRFPGTL